MRSISGQHFRFQPSRSSIASNSSGPAPNLNASCLVGFPIKPVSRCCQNDVPVSFGESGVKYTNMDIQCGGSSKCTLTFSACRPPENAVKNMPFDDSIDLDSSSQ